MSERLICRFCDKSNWRILFDASTHAQQVECASCLARGPLADSLDNAIAAWGRRAPSAEQLEVLRRVWQPHTQSNVDRMSEKDIAEEISCAVESAEQQSDQLSLDGEGGVTRRRDAERYRWLKRYNKLDGWNDENIDRDIAIEAAVFAQTGAEVK